MADKSKELTLSKTTKEKVASVDLSKITYRQEGSAVRVSDGSDWHLDISEVGWR